MKFGIGSTFWLFFCCPFLAGGQIVGEIAIAEQVYAVTGTFEPAADGYRGEVRIIAGEAVLKTATFDTGAKSLFVNGSQYELDSEKATLWDEDLSAAFANLLDRYTWAETATETNFVYDSPGIIKLRAFLPSKIRLIYSEKDGKPFRLLGVRLFSLAEWNNVFREDLSFSLDFKP